MKKDIYLAMLPIVLMVLGFAACSEYDNTPRGYKPPTPPADNRQNGISSIITTETGEQLLLTGINGALESGETMNWWLTYDKKGRLAEGSVDMCDEASCKLSYKPFKIEFGDWSAFWGYRPSISGTLNREGYLATLSVADRDAESGDTTYLSISYLEYDKEGHLLKVKTEFNDQPQTGDEMTDSAFWDFTWINGNMEDAYYTENTEAGEAVTSYMLGYYNGEKNKYRQYTVGMAEMLGMDALALAGLIGKGPDKLPWGIDTSYTLNGERDDSKYDMLGCWYTLNEDGTIANERTHERIMGGTIPTKDVYTYTYTTIGTAPQKAPATRTATVRKAKPFRPFRIIR